MIGVGKVFCVGVDLSVLGVGVGDLVELRLLWFYDGFMVVSSCNLFIIVVVNGVVVGVGFNLVLVVDVCIVGLVVLFDVCF